MTDHHFRLYPDGGAVEVESNRLDDDATKAAIHRQMHKFAGMFAQGDFTLPVFIHDTVPAGVLVNEAFKGSNRVYSREYRQGGEVRIATRNTGALVAVHEFLRSRQRRRTGDPLVVQPNPSS